MPEDPKSESDTAPSTATATPANAPSPLGSFFQNIPAQPVEPPKDSPTRRYRGVPKTNKRNTSPWNSPDRARPPSASEQVAALTASPEGLAQFLTMLDAQAAKTSFAVFFRQAWKEMEPGTPLVWNWHLDLLCTVMQCVFMDWLRPKRMRGGGPFKYVNLIKNIAINVPPGSSKSGLLARALQAWMWLHFPALKLIALSVNDDATMRDARATRDLVRSNWYQSLNPGFQIKGDQDAISSFGNTEGGNRISLPMKSEVVGLRASCLIIDDANNPKKAANKNERDEINEIWDSTLYNRVEDAQRSLRIGIQQRVHAQDWTGHVIETQGIWAMDNRDGWLHVVIPAEFEEARRFVMPPELVAVLDRPLEGFELLPVLRRFPGGDLALTAPGERMNPNAVRVLTQDPRTVEGESMDIIRMPKSVLDGERRRWSKSGSFAGQMQQRPALAEGAMVQRKWWGFCRLAEGVRDAFDGLDNGRPRPAHCIPREEMEAHVIHAAQHNPGNWDFDWMTISVDPAAKKTDRGSLYGLLVIAGKGGRRFVLDDRSQRGAFHEILEVLVEMINFWKPDRLLIEPKAAGPDLMDTLRERMAAGDVPMVSIEECEPGNSDKEMRLEACLPYLKNGMVYLLEGAPWLEEFVNELSMFPNGAQSDRVDALSQCLNTLRVADDAWPAY